MAAKATKTTVTKPSFASIAAMAPPPLNGKPPKKSENERFSAAVPGYTKKAAAVDGPSQQLHQELRTSMSRLTVKGPLPAPKPLNDQQKGNISRAGLRLDDDQTQVSSSSTKPASLDGKSTTSGTTFALDEKESLRPDDSASAKAAEDDESASGPASGAQNSRVGSETGSRAFRDQFHEINENMGSASHRMTSHGRRKISGIEEEASPRTHSPHVSSLPTPVDGAPAQLLNSNGNAMGLEYRKPDEKLLEALEVPKDRLFLLKLEQQVIKFIQDPLEPPMIDLPPCNSFCRLLAHKLAEYYGLSHFVDNAVSCVRLHRTPYCRVRVPLSAVAVAPVPAAIDVTIPAQPAMKIMRRVGLGKDGQNSSSGINTTESSMAPSKAGSEIGFDSQQGTGVASPTESTVAKDKSAMTREEREAKYKETRERIFGPEADSAESTEVAKEVSRTSSRNEKKKKKHRNNDDGFTARSQFNVYYPQMHFPVMHYEQTGDSSIYYSPYMMQPSSPLPQAGYLGTPNPDQGYQLAYPPGPDPQAFSGTMTSNPMVSGYEMQNGGGYNPHLPQTFYPPMQHVVGMNMGQQSPAMSSPANSVNGQFPGPQQHIADQQWAQNGYGYPYQQSRDQQQYFPPQAHGQTQMAGVQSVPYQFGQLPVPTGIHGAKSQHPVPGSYKSQTFNPQTRAFIPNGGSAPLQPSTNPNHPMGHIPTVPFSTGGQYPGYNQQAPLYPQMPSMPMPPPYNLSHESKNNGARKSSAPSNATQSPIQSSLSKWGTPANLPPKPPPPETPNIPEGQHSLPLNNHFNVNVQPTNAGQPMPSFQNGVYSMPGANPQMI